jgi:predicted secreted hydrolase
MQASQLAAAAEEDPGASLLRLKVQEWEVEINAGLHRIMASDEAGNALELQFAFDPSTGPTLHNGIGWLASAGGWTYYYSWPDMAVTGTLTTGGVDYQVGGAGWFDHQWGDFFVLGAPAGWQWMALRLGGGSTLMVNESRSPDGETVLYGTWSDGEGLQRSLEQGRDFMDLQVLDWWTSPETGGVYPSRWRLQIGGLNLDVEISPVLADQEVKTGVPLAATYWEGKVEATGVYRGRQIAQPGYVELTGYVPLPDLPWRQ